MQCANCIHWVEPHSVESLPGYPIGFCELFQKDVAGEYAGCAGRFFLPRDRSQWVGKLLEVKAPANKALEVPLGAKIVSISDNSPETNEVTVVYLMPAEK